MRLREKTKELAWRGGQPVERWWLLTHVTITNSQADCPYRHTMQYMDEPMCTIDGPPECEVPPSDRVVPDSAMLQVVLG